MRDDPEATSACTKIGGLRGLAGAILRQAVLDLDDPRHAEDALLFLSGSWFATLCDGLGVDAFYVQEQALQSVAANPPNRAPAASGRVA